MLMIAGTVILVLSAAYYLRLQLHALVNWRGARRIAAVLPLLGWMVFYQQAEAASPSGYITDNLLPIELWCTFVNGALFLLIAGKLFARRNAWSRPASSR